jgi:hypothetical protein
VTADDAHRCRSIRMEEHAAHRVALHAGRGAPLSAKAVASSPSVPLRPPRNAIVWAGAAATRDPT